METQCPVCRQWFRIAREQAEAAHGLARCGDCDTVFNALATLREAAPEPRQENAAAPGEPEPDAKNSAASVAAEPQDAPPAPLEEPARGHRATRGLWAAAFLVAALALAAQLVHANRYRIARAPIAGPALRTIYGALGHPLRPRLVLARYVLSDASLASAADGSGVLRLTGRLVNRAAFTQRLPLVRLSLRDRAGDVIASRLLLPSDYAPTTINTLAAGRALRFTVAMADPGARATGFTLVLCKQGARRVLCRAS